MKGTITNFKESSLPESIPVQFSPPATTQETMPQPTPEPTSEGNDSISDTFDTQDSSVDANMVDAATQFNMEGEQNKQNTPIEPPKDFDSTMKSAIIDVFKTLSSQDLFEFLKGNDNVSKDDFFSKVINDQEELLMFRNKVVSHQNKKIPYVNKDLEAHVKKEMKGTLRKLVVTYGKFKLFKKDLQPLEAGKKVNTEIIDVYLKMIQSRSETSKDHPLVFSFPTHFFIIYSQMEYDYNAVKNVVEDNDKIFSKELLFFPIFLENINHMTLVCANLRTKKLIYYDSLIQEGGDEINRMIEKYLKLKHLEEKGIPLGDFDCTEDLECPQQSNKIDCGIYLMLNSEFLSRQSALDFNHENIPEYRSVILHEIVSKQLLRF